MTSSQRVPEGGCLNKLAPLLSSKASSTFGLQAAWDLGTDEELHAAFRAFASFGGGTPKSAQPRACELDGKGFVKMCRDSGLLDVRLNTTAIDLIFSRVRGKVRCLRTRYNCMHPPALEAVTCCSAFNSLASKCSMRCGKFSRGEKLTLC